jgi:hypothetical protein
VAVSQSCRIAAAIRQAADTFWVVQISRNLQRCPVTCTRRCAGILSNEIGAELSGNGASVVFVQTIKGQAVAEQSRGLTEHRTSHLQVHRGSGLGYLVFPPEADNRGMTDMPAAPAAGETARRDEALSNACIEECMRQPEAGPLEGAVPLGHPSAAQAGQWWPNPGGGSCGLLRGRVR